MRSGLVALQVPMRVRGVVENMSYFEHAGERIDIFGTGGGARVSSQLTDALHYEVPLMAQLPLDPRIREIGESEGRPAVLNDDGTLRDDDFGRTFGHLPRVFWHSKLACGSVQLQRCPHAIALSGRRIIARRRWRAKCRTVARR